MTIHTVILACETCSALFGAVWPPPTTVGEARAQAREAGWRNVALLYRSVPSCDFCPECVEAGRDETHMLKLIEEHKPKRTHTIPLIPSGERKD